MKTLNGLALGLGLFTVVSLVSGCSLAPQEQKLVRIELPRSSQVAQKAANASYKDPLAPLIGGSSYVASRTFVPSPTSWDGIKCFGINVMGPGIAPDPRMQCQKAGEEIGIAGGLIYAVDGGVIELMVPAGPGRRVQLFGLNSVVGCPSLNEIFNQEAVSGQSFDGLGDPYLLGENVVDIVDDTTVEIAAAFDPNRRIFQGCGGEQGTKIPLKYGFKGYQSIMPVPSPTPMASAAPAIPIIGTSAANADDLVGATLLSDAELLLIADREYTADGGGVGAVADSSNSVIHSLSFSGSPSEGHRAVIQLQWDITDLDQSLHPYAKVSLQFTGGVEPYDQWSNCDQVQYAPAYSSLFWTATGTTIAPHSWFGGRNVQGPDLMDWTSYVRFQDIAFQKGDGRTYAIVDVYSSFVANQSMSWCNSVVKLGGATLYALDAPEPLHISPDTPQIMNGETIYYGGWGGVAPYSLTLTSGVGSVSGNSYHAPTSVDATLGADARLTLTDAIGQTDFVDLHIVQNPVTAMQLLDAFSASAPSFLMGGCSGPYMLQSFGGNVPPGNMFVSLSTSGGAKFHKETGCTDIGQSTLGGLLVPAGSTESQVFYINVPFAENSIFISFYSPSGSLGSSSFGFAFSCSDQGWGFAYQTDGGPALCDANDKAQSFQLDHYTKLTQIDLNYAIEQWPYLGGGGSLRLLDVYVMTDNLGTPGSQLDHAICYAPDGYSSSHCIADFTGGVTLNPFQTYWIQVSSSSIFQFCWQGSSGSMYGPGAAYYHNGTGWVVATSASGPSDYRFTVRGCKN